MIHPMRLASAALALSMLGTTARAEFDEVTGYEAFGPDEIGVGFEGAADLAAFGDVTFGGVSEQVPAETLELLLEQDPRGMLEGRRALQLGGQIGSLAITLEEAANRMADRRVEFRLWYRPEGAELYAAINFLAVPLLSLPEESSETFSPPGSVQLLPTGRATSDGWIELSSGPVDFTLAGEVRARSISLFNTHTLESFIYQQGSSVDGTVLVDGLSVRDLGEPLATGDACLRKEEAEACVEGAACFLGRCVDARPVLGSLPLTEEMQREYLQRQVDRARLMMGSRYAVSVMDDFEARLLALVGADPVTWWGGMRRAYNDLADGHNSMPSRRQPYSTLPGACLYLGEADLLPREGLHPLVFEVNAEHPLGAMLQPGDAWVEVDGESIDEFRARSNRDLSYGGDPRGRDVNTTPRLLSAAFQAGATVVFERCTLDAGEGPCAAEQVERIEVNLADMTAPLWSGDLLSWRFANPEANCDFRLHRGFDLPEAGRGSFVGQREDDGVTTLYLNGVSGRGRWSSQANAALDALNDRVILDQRRGNGGTFEGVNLILEPFLAAESTFFAEIVPQIAPEFTEADRAAIEACYENGESTFGLCGGYFAEELGGRGERRGALAGARLAIVNGEDVSGNDYLPRGLKDFRDPALTRVFGPAPTFGAYGPIYQLPRALGEVFGGTFQLHDTLFVDAEGIPSEFSTGFGVEPDVVVFQRQSDLRLGVDTLIETAKAWLLEGDD